ncbi:MAG: VOC family protein [Verrucomicrobia bacterium]|nr:VOC family protein [Verrucomicrobiota bacterium]
MKIVEVAFTGYPVSDMERARTFYEGLLKLEPSRILANGHWIEYDLGPSTFAINNTAPDQWKPSSDGPAIAFEVDGFDAAVDALRARDVRFEVEPFESPVCWMAIIADPDGNSIAIHKRKVG